MQKLNNIKRLIAEVSASLSRGPTPQKPISRVRIQIVGQEGSFQKHSRCKTFLCVHIISYVNIIENLLFRISFFSYKFFEQNRRNWCKYVNTLLLAAYFLACYCFYKCGWNKSWKSEARQTFGYLFPQPQSCGEPSTMDQLFANHLNKDYPRVSPRDGRNTSSHFVKIATLQGRGEGQKPVKSKPPDKTW